MQNEGWIKLKGLMMDNYNQICSIWCSQENKAVNKIVDDLLSEFSSQFKVSMGDKTDARNIDEEFFLIACTAHFKDGAALNDFAQSCRNSVQ